MKLYIHSSYPYEHAILLYLSTVLCLVCSHTIVGSENQVALRVTSSQAKANSQPNREGSSSEEQDGGQDSSAKTQAGLDQSVGQHEVPLDVSFEGQLRT